MSDQRKYEKPFFLNMDFSEALERFVRTDPKEVAISENSCAEVQRPKAIHRRKKPVDKSDKY